MEPGQIRGVLRGVTREGRFPFLASPFTLLPGHHEVSSFSSTMSLCQAILPWSLLTYHTVAEKQTKSQGISQQWFHDLMESLGGDGNLGSGAWLKRVGHGCVTLKTVQIPYCYPSSQALALSLAAPQLL